MPSPELRSYSGTIPDEALGLIASLSDPIEAAALVTLWDASIQGNRWHEWRTVAAFEKDKLQGAIVARVQPGRLASLWPPRTQPTTLGSLADIARALRPTAEDDFEHEQAQWAAANESTPDAEKAPAAMTVADQLLFRLIAELQQEGIRLIQSVLPTSADADALVLARGGFNKLADLLYLSCSEEALHEPAATTTPEPFSWRPYTPADHDLLCEILAGTYEGSLDCPALNGQQSPADILAGYRQTGQSETSGWRLFFQGEQPAGCLLMASHQADHVAELVYMGLLPSARGQRGGRQLVRLAQTIAREWDSEQLVLAVDAANRPARRMYEKCGFAEWDRRRVFIRTIGPAALQPGEPI